MRVLRTQLAGLLLVQPRVATDARGSFMETWNAARYAAHGLPLAFVQDNVSGSRRGVLRGLHFQNPYPQGKLIGVQVGRIWDVAVDIRPDSATFRRWEAFELSAENALQLYIPEGFAHGFLALSKYALVGYKCTDYYHPEAEVSIRWNDPAFGIDWPVPTPILSARDAAAPLFESLPQELLARCDIAASDE